MRQMASLYLAFQPEFSQWGKSTGSEETLQGCRLWVREITLAMTATFVSSRQTANITHMVLWHHSHALFHFFSVFLFVSMSLTHKHVLSVWWTFFVHSVNHPYIVSHYTCLQGMVCGFFTSFPTTTHTLCTQKLANFPRLWSLWTNLKVQGRKNGTLFLPNHQGAQGPCIGENLSLYLVLFLTAALVTVVMTFTITLTFAAAGGTLLAAGFTAAALHLATIQSSLQLGPQGPLPGLKVSVNTWGRTWQRRLSGSVLHTIASTLFSLFFFSKWKTTAIRRKERG